MEPQSNGYKWATWILVIVVIVLGVMLTKRNTDTVTDTLTDANDSIVDCRAELAAWQTAHPAGTPRTAQDQTDLEAILADCLATVEDVQDEI